MSKAPPGSYPKQGAQYPRQQQMPAYPTQPQQMQYQPQYGAPGPMYGVPPPPYTETPLQHTGVQQPASSGMYYPQQAPNVQQYSGMAPGGQYPRQQYPVGQYPAQGAPQPAVHGAFDPGARFGAGATVNIPPPPPGYAPNAAQASAAQGQPVNVQQRQAGWFSGGTDGGYTFW